MLNRRLSLKLLAPTVLVSLVLVAACCFGALYLNYLNVKFSAVLSENVQSVRVAARLETAAKELIRLLGHPGPQQQNNIREQNQVLRELLTEADELANHEGEIHYVSQIRDGLKVYLDDWDRRALSASAASDAELADYLQKKILAPAIALRDYNATQVENSDRVNRSIVHKVQWGLMAVGLAAPLSGLLLGYAISRGFNHSIYQLSVGIRDAAGRLKRELGSVTVNEVSDLPELQQQMQGVLVEIEKVVEQLQQREREVLRAEQLAAVGQVAAGVAHELRNPLTAIKMLVQTGLEGTPPAGLPPDDLPMMEAEIRRMEQCLKLLTDFARPPQSERRPANLGELIRRALALVEGRARRQAVRLSADLPHDPVVRDVDADQIHQVLLNLLLNALDALPRGGHIRVSLDVRLATLADTLPAVEVRVQDDGPGIAPPIYERLFEPFVSSRETGLGLGLSISKRLVEGHGGTIRGENRPEGGAAFTFTLPEE